MKPPPSHSSAATRSTVHTATRSAVMVSPSSCCTASNTPSVDNVTISDNEACSMSRSWSTHNPQAVRDNRPTPTPPLAVAYWVTYFSTTWWNNTNELDANAGWCAVVVLLVLLVLVLLLVWLLLVMLLLWLLCSFENIMTERL
jgi:hypothetical protein